MDAVSASLLEAFLDAYRPFVRARLDDLDLPAVEAAIDAGAAWLETSLADLLDQPYRSQRRTPLEVFQEALFHPTEALAELGAPPVARDAVAVAALPGDRFGLAPTSSHELGDAAWQAHLAWGAAKAAAMRPSAIVITRNLLDGSRIAEAAEAAGYRLVTSSVVPGEVDRHAVGFVDLEHPDADAAVRSLAATCGRVVAFGPHVDDLALTRARSLGATDAVPRSRFFAGLLGWFPAVA